MCGLTGILFYPSPRPFSIWEEIKDTFTRCLLFNQERGKEASGIALIYLDRTHWLFKKSVSAKELIQTKEYPNILDRLNENVVVLLGHTREPTKGSPIFSYNNHPIKIERIIGIHNGKLENDDELFEQFKFPRQGQVDSEIIFWLINDNSPWLFNSRNYLQKLRQDLNLIKGSFTILAVDLTLPNRLIVAKKDRPLCLHYEPSWNALIFSSRYLFLRKAFGKQVISEALESGYIYWFDAFLLKKLKTNPLKKILLNHSKN